MPFVWFPSFDKKKDALTARGRRAWAAPAVEVSNGLGSARVHSPGGLGRSVDAVPAAGPVLAVLALLSHCQQPCLGQKTTRSLGRCIQLPPFPHSLKTNSFGLGHRCQALSYQHPSGSPHSLSNHVGLVRGDKWLELESLWEAEWV